MLNFVSLDRKSQHGIKRISTEREIKVTTCLGTDVDHDQYAIVWCQTVIIMSTSNQKFMHCYRDWFGKVNWGTKLLFPIYIMQKQGHIGSNKLISLWSHRSWRRHCLSCAWFEYNKLWKSINRLSISGKKKRFMHQEWYKRAKKSSKSHRIKATLVPRNDFYIGAGKWGRKT